MAQNQAPETESFCVESFVPDDSPAIRFIGGIAIEPQVDPNSGPPSSCGLTMDLVGNLQAAMASFQPFLAVLDLVATLAQITQLLTELVTSPTPSKVLKLLRLIPGLNSKINTVLQLVPVFPQGIQAFVTFVIDVVRFVGTQIDCVVSILTAIKGQLDELARIAQAINDTTDVSLKASLQALYDCGKAEADRQASISLGALGPIARILCATRALLRNVKGGDDIQKFMKFPDPTSITVIDEAIVALKLTRDVLLTTEELVVALTLGLGALPPLDIGFKCPLDEGSTELPTPALVPTITQVLGANDLPIAAPLPAGVDTIIQIVGTNFDEESQVFWTTAQIPAENVQLADTTRLTVTVPSDFAFTGEYDLSVVNTPKTPSSPTGFLAAAFSGLTDDDDTGVQVSDLFPIEVA